MRTKRCMWTDNNNYDIELKTSNGNNSDRMELRTYALFLDYSHNDNFKCDCTNWMVGIWPKGRSCMYFERDCTLNRRNIKSPLMSISLTNKYNANAKITMPSTYSSGPSILMLYQKKNGWLL